MAADFIAKLVALGWVVEPPLPGFSFAETGYLKAPIEMRQMMALYGALANAKGTTWLVSVQDLRKQVEGFAWNEFELISLEAVGDDEKWKREIRAFWADHLPLMLSVEGRYEYVAYCTSGPNADKYVQGTEPEFEDVTVVAST